MDAEELTKMILRTGDDPRDYILVKDLVDDGTLPNCIPVFCECGAPFVTNSNMTKTKCVNPECPIHNSYKTEKAFDILGVKGGVGALRAQDLARQLRYPDFMDIFNVDYIRDRMRELGVYHKSVVDTLSKFEDKNNNEGFTLPTIMHVFQFKNIGATQSVLIFSGLNNFEDFLMKAGYYEDKDNKHVFCDYVSDKIKVSKYSDTVKGISEVLYYNIDYILKYEKLFNKKNSNLLDAPTIFIVISGAINKVLNDNGERFLPRETFADYLTDKYGINVECISSISKKNIDFLITDGGMENNNKFKKAQKFGIEVMDSLQFKEYIENLSNKVKEDDPIGTGIEW